ncbi:hypothetical protein ACQP0I_01915 [Micromonospora carbonacea]|uniref:hypothetical protein n=1 Tax=Micromonospora carbonacea TaxID=47853 RepID=UPI003D9953D6
MEKRHVGTLVVVLACVTVVGAVGGTYLATRGDGATADRTVDAGSTVDAGRQTGGPEAGEEAAPAQPARPSSGTPTGSSDSSSSGSSGGGSRTYRLDRTFYDQASMTVTLVSAEVTGSKLRLNVRYRNGSATAPWALECSPVAEDRELVLLTLADGRTVRPESTYCSTRPGESIELAPGRDLASWAVFPVAPQAGSSLDLSWYDFPTTDLTLR